MTIEEALAVLARHWHKPREVLSGFIESNAPMYMWDEWAYEASVSEEYEEYVIEYAKDLLSDDETIWTTSIQ